LRRQRSPNNAKKNGTKDIMSCPDFGRKKRERTKSVSGCFDGEAKAKCATQEILFEISKLG